MMVRQILRHAPGQRCRWLHLWKGLLASVLFFASAFVPPAWADGRYLSEPQIVAIEEIVPPPPDDASEEHRAEEEYIVWAQQHATAEANERARSEFALSLEAFQAVLGPAVPLQQIPQTEILMEAVRADTQPLWHELKARFHRNRPALGDARIRPLDRLADNQHSYPSAHSFNGALMALILAELFPEQQEELLARGREIGWDRVLAGMHHPSDIGVSRVLAQAVFHELLKNQRFREDLARAKTEIAGLSSPRREPASRINREELP